MGLFNRSKKKREIPMDSLKDSITPHRLGNIPEMAIALGMIRQDHFKVYNLCTGNIDIAKISEDVHMELENVKRILMNLYKMALVEI